MDNEIASAIAELKAQGIAVDPSDNQATSYVATAPNGEKYELDTAALLNLKAEEKLDLEGLQDAHLAKVETPDLS